MPTEPTDAARSLTMTELTTEELSAELLDLARTAVFQMEVNRVFRLVVEEAAARLAALSKSEAELAEIAERAVGALGQGCYINAVEMKIIADYAAWKQQQETGDAAGINSNG